MSGPVLAFDINATRGGKITRVSKQAPATTRDAPAPTMTAPTVAPVISAAPRADDRYSQKAKVRADLAATYAGLLGMDIVRSDLLEVMTAEDGDDISPKSIAKALNAAGLITSVTMRTKPTPIIGPHLWK